MASARWASFVFIVVLLSGVALVGAANSEQPPPATAPIQTSPQPCAQAYPPQSTNETTLSNGTEITQVAVPAVVMSPGSTAALCVDYTGGSYSGQAYTSVSPWESSGSAAGENVSVSATPGEVFLTQGESVDVEYTVTAGQGSTGFYGLGLLQECIPVPLAVGYEAFQVNSTDFPGYFGARFGCPAQSLGGQIVGYTGASIGYLRAESRFSPTVNFTTVSVSSVPTAQGGVNDTFRMEVESFSHPITAGLSLNDSIVRVFGGNPDLITLPANDYCSWYPSNTGEVNDMTTTEFQDIPAGSIQIDAPVLHLGTYSNSTYSFSILISGPIAKYTAVDTVLYAGGPGGSQENYDIVAYFPVSVSGQLQSFSGQCEGSSSG
jgi:hypothetical protein